MIASGIGGALNLGSDFAATVTGGSLALNRSSTGTGFVDWSTVPGLSGASRVTRRRPAVRSRSPRASGSSPAARPSLTRTAITTGTYTGDTLSDFELTLDPATPLLIGTSDYGLSLTSGTVRLLSLTGGPVSYSGVIASGIDGALNLGTDFAATVTGGTLALNRSSTGTDFIDWSTVPGLSAVTLADDTTTVGGTVAITKGFGFFTGGATFSLTRTAITTGTYTGYALSDFELTLDSTTPLLIGTSDYGLSLTSGTVRLLSLSKPGATAYSGVIASGIGGALNLGTDFAATVTGGSLALNRSSTGTGAIDWSTVPGLSAVTLSGDTTAAGGTIVITNGFGLFTGGATFTLARSTLASGPYAGAALSDFTLTIDSANPLVVGTSDYGVQLTSGTLRLLSLTPTDPTDTRRWSGITASGIDGSISLGSLVTASVSGLGVTANSFTGQTAGGVAATALDWNPIAGVDLSGDATTVSGELENLDIAGLITGRAHFDLTRKSVTLTGTTDPALTNAQLMRFSLSSLELAVGTATAGVTLGATKFDLVTLASGLVGDTRRWLLIDAAGVTGTLTLPGITGSITGLTLQVNRASGGGAAGFAAASALDWSRVPGEGLTASGDHLSVDGELEGLDIFHLLGGQAHFSLSRTEVDVPTLEPRQGVAAEGAALARRHGRHQQHRPLPDRRHERLRRPHRRRDADLRRARAERREHDRPPLLERAGGHRARRVDVDGLAASPDAPSSRGPLMSFVDCAGCEA